MLTAASIFLGTTVTLQKIVGMIEKYNNAVFQSTEHEMIVITHDYAINCA